jgi:hypothetical protein
MAQRPKKLLDQVRDAIRLKHYSIRTEESYVDWTRRFVLFHDKRHPQEIARASAKCRQCHCERSEAISRLT